MSTFSNYTVVRGDTLFAISRKFGMTVEEIKSLNGLTSNNLNIGQLLRVRVADAPPPPVQAQAPPAGGSTQLYTVQPGDTLFGISRKFGVTVDELVRLNGLSSNNLSIGQVLRVHGSGNVSTPPPVQQPVQQPSQPSSGNAGQTYIVVRGDTLFGVARKFGMTVSALKSLNGLVSDGLSVGQVLRVGGQAPVSAPQPQPQPDPQPQTPTGSGDARFRLEVRQEAGFKRYFLTVPLLSGGQVVANMIDHVNSRHMIFPEGVMYAGQSHMALLLSDIEAVGLTTMQARALQYVSTHEGSFDAINSYDKAIFSYGFIQFAGAAAVGGSLNRLMVSMENNAPFAFQQIFKRAGIDTEGFGSSAVVTVTDQNGMRRRGDDAWLYIQRNIPLYGAFIQAGFEPSLVREQLRMANELYVQPALNFKLDVTIGGIHLSVPRIGDIFRSEAALTTIIALAINQGTGGMSRILAPAVSTVASQQRLQSVGALSQIDERRVFETIAATTTDDRVSNRVNGVMNSGLRFA
jgi:LysM repeat protein